MKIEELKRRDKILREAADSLGVEPERLPENIKKFKKEMK